MRYIGHAGPLTRAQATERLERYVRCWQEHGLGMFGVRLRDQPMPVGWAGLQPLSGTDEIEVGYAFGKSAWGRGYATEVASALVQWGFEALGLERIVAVASPENAASRRVMDKLGMRYEGDAARHRPGQRVLLTHAAGVCTRRTPSRFRALTDALDCALGQAPHDAVAATIAALEVGCLRVALVQAIVPHPPVAQRARRHIRQLGERRVPETAWARWATRAAPTLRQTAPATRRSCAACGSSTGRAPFAPLSSSTQFVPS